MSLSIARSAVSVADARRLEEYALNASGAFQSLVYDGWLLGYRRGSTKRLRCVNALHPSTLPIAEKIEHCRCFYRGIDLPPLFRLLAFSEPADLDRQLEKSGWNFFERTLVLHADLGSLRVPALPPFTAELCPVPEWVEATAELLAIAEENKPGALDRARTYPLPQIGAIVLRDGLTVGCGLAKLEDDAVGIFALATAPALRGHGLGRSVLAALLEEARRRGARRAYLQVSASNVPALTLYSHFGFAEAYEYWYRALD
jgi:GNAT superfamily N-acetyltransferase